jgi:pyruvate/2-oxoglutarate dehydrogenase complex dihydrolipoamide dehydrogenase (E3) component
MSTNVPKPKKFDRNLIVIGAGSGGLVASYIAAALKAKVTLIERHQMGGDCLNTGCVPSKALIRSAKVAQQMRDASKWAIEPVEPIIDFAKVMDRVQDVIKTIEPHDSIERYTSLSVEVITGEAKIIDPYTVVVNGQQLTSRNIIVATGARPFVPPIKGIENSSYLTSDTLWSLREQPKRLLVLGGGPIGCELTQAFSRLGSEVTQVEMMPAIMGREDADVAEFVRERFTAEGIKVLTSHKAIEFTENSTGKVLLAEFNNEVVEIPYDQVIIAVGRAANTTGFGLEELGVEVERTIKHNDFLQTNIPSIYVCGDVAGPYQFTHTAAHQAWFAVVNALFSPIKKFAVNYDVIPWATFTDPEVARVGLNEADAQAKGIAYEVTTYGLDDLDRAIADGEAEGWVKVITAKGKDKILGATIVGSHSGELIAEFVMAMRHGLGMNKLLSTIHIYPTWAESNKFAAGNWKKAHKPDWALSLLEKYWKWRRG